MDGLTYICSGNGDGKTTISKALNGKISGAKIKHIGHVNAAIPDWIIYFDWDIRLPCIGAPWDPLTNLLETEVFSNLNWSQFESAITLGIRELLREKIRHDPTKFSKVISSTQQIDFRFGKDGQINVFDNVSGSDLNWCFQAHGEHIVLYLAINRALRRQVPSDLDLPFVIDSCLGPLDDNLNISIIEFIQNMAGQVILLDDCHRNGRFRLTANFEIRREAKSVIEKSRIVACQ